MQVYIQNNRRSYVVSVPLVNKGEFKAYYFVPVPIPVNKDKLIYIRTAKSILCVWIKHGNITILAPTLNYKKAKNPPSKGTFVNRTNPYYLASYRNNVLCDF